MEQFTLKKDTNHLKIEDTKIYKSHVVEVEDYIDLGTWDSIKNYK